MEETKDNDGVEVAVKPDFSTALSKLVSMHNAIAPQVVDFLNSKRKRRGRHPKTKDTDGHTAALERLFSCPEVTYGR